MGRKLRFFGLALLVLFGIIFGGVFISTLFFPSANEILYRAEIITTTCNSSLAPSKENNKPCITLYELRIGNTGSKTQEMVRITMRGSPGLRETGSKLLDIFASTKKQPVPDIKRLDSPFEKIYEISPFPENKILILSFYAPGYQDYLALKKMKIRIEARGKIVNLDPQITVLARIFKKIFGIFF
jgi:hypothetical protein